MSAEVDVDDIDGEAEDDEEEDDDEIPPKVAASVGVAESEVDAEVAELRWERKENDLVDVRCPGFEKVRDVRTRVE